MRMSDWSSDVFSSELALRADQLDEGARLSRARRLSARGGRRGAAADAARDRLDAAHGAMDEAEQSRTLLCAHLCADGAARRHAAMGRSEERQVGKEGDSKCGIRWGRFIINKQS